MFKVPQDLALDNEINHLNSKEVFFLSIAWLIWLKTMASKTVVSAVDLQNWFQN